MPYSTEYRQVGKFVELNWAPNQPNLFLWAAEQGVPVSLLIEMSGNRSGTHALVMNVDTTIEICLAVMTNCLAKYGELPTARHTARSLRRATSHRD